ncbi:hypothetical protein D3C79_852980 [compost metagenome]
MQQWQPRTGTVHVVVGIEPGSQLAGACLSRSFHDIDLEVTAVQVNGRVPAQPQGMRIKGTDRSGFTIQTDTNSRNIGAPDVGKRRAAPLQYLADGATATAAATTDTVHGINRELAGGQGITDLAARRDQHAPEPHINHLSLVTVGDRTAGVSALTGGHQQAKQRQPLGRRFVQRKNPR